MYYIKDPDNNSDHLCNGSLGSQPRILRHLSHSLSDTEVAQDIFGATKECVESYSTVVMFDKVAHSCSGNSTSTEDLNSVRRGLLSTFRAVHLQQTDGTCQFRGLFLIRLEMQFFPVGIRLTYTKDVYAPCCSSDM